MFFQKTKDVVFFFVFFVFVVSFVPNAAGSVSA